MVSGFSEGASMSLQNVETRSGGFAEVLYSAQQRLVGAVHHTGDFLQAALSQPLAADELIALAQRRVGLTDFGASIEGPLQILVQDYQEEAELNLLGRITARWDTLRFLTNLLLLRDAEKRDPGILEQPIVAPIFITGLPRSGTTFLHKLLCEDPANRAVLCWETIFPLPAPGTMARSPEARAAKVDRQLAAFARIAPEMPKMHPIDARSPQECSEIIAHVFRSLRFDTTHHVPRYRDWMDRTGFVEAFRFHKRFLQHLQHRKGPGPWVLKCPDHVFALDALREVYPDARIVIMHRDPIEVLRSVTRLTEVLRKPFTRRIDRLQIGRQVSERWARGAEILLETAERMRDAPAPIIHVTFRRFTDDPVGCVGALYGAFGLRFDAALAARLRDAVAAQPNGGYGQNRYRLEDYGLDPDAERRRYRDYTKYFQV
jgi:hypothetical protein